MGKRGRPRLPDEERKKRKAKRYREWAQRHKEQVNLYIKRYNERLRLSVLKVYGRPNPKCSCCGESELKFLVIDHIQGKGNIHRRSVVGKGGGYQFYRWIKNNNYPSGFQVLCHNCNMAKALYGICPHEEKRKKEAN